MAAYPYCVRAIPYKNDEETQTSFTMRLYVDNYGKEIPKMLEEASQRVFAGYKIEYYDFQEMARCKLVTQLTDKRRCTQELSNLTKTIEENLHVFENRLNVMAVQASYKIKDNVEKDIPCVTIYVLGKGKIPVGETDVMTIKTFPDYPFDIVEGYYRSCVCPEKSYVYTLHAGVGIGVRSDGVFCDKDDGDHVVGNGVESNSEITNGDESYDGMGCGHKTVGHEELTNVIENESVVRNVIESDGKIGIGKKNSHEEGIECENVDGLENVVKSVGRLVMEHDGRVGNSDNGVGTLGGFLEDQYGTPFILSCQHVLCPDENGNKFGAIIQPAQCDYEDECALANERIEFYDDQLIKLGEKREMIEENDQVKIKLNEKHKKNFKKERKNNEKIVENKPRVIGKYCNGLKQNENFKSTDGSHRKIYVDAAFATLESEEVSKIELYREMESKTVVGFGTMILKEKNLPCTPSGTIVDLEKFSQELEKTPEPRFWKIGRTTGLTTNGIPESNLFQNDHAYKRKICAGDLSVVPTSVFCCDCEKMTDENQVDVSCIEWPVSCAICSKEIGKDLGLSCTSASWKYNCLAVKTPEEKFCEKGDSGALVFDNLGRAWGILFGQFSIPGKNVRIGLAEPLSVALHSLGRLSGKKFKLW